MTKEQTNQNEEKILISEWDFIPGEKEEVIVSDNGSTLNIMAYCNEVIEYRSPILVEVPIEAVLRAIKDRDNKIED